MRIVSFGDLYLDYYLNNGELLGVSGGKTNANILASLSKYYNTAFIGVTGNDSEGLLAKKSLGDLGVNVDKIKEIESNTNLFFYDHGYTKVCPYCNRKCGYSGYKFDPIIIRKNVTEDDIIIVDNIEEETLKVITGLNNIKFLDLGYYKDIMYDTLDELKSKISDKFKVINLNERVYSFLKEKFLLDNLDWWEIFGCDLLIITRGKKGADFVYNYNVDRKEIENPAKEVETNGCGDAFYSEVIRTLIENNYELNDRVISKCFMRGQSLSKYVVSHYGARCHLRKLYKITNYKECICKKIEVK